MKKIVFLFFLLVFLNQTKVLAWTNGDAGIQRFYQNAVPQFTNSGKIQNFYSNDSFFPLGIYFADLGPIRDINGSPQSQMWNWLGFTDLTSTNTLPSIKAAGFNTVMPYERHVFPNEAEMNFLDSYGLKGILNVLPIARDATYNLNSQTIATFKNYITRAKFHSSTFAYHLFDEYINGSDPAHPMDQTKWKVIYDAIKSVDPSRPVFGNYFFLDCPNKSINDIGSHDMYTSVNYTDTTGAVREYTDYLRLVDGLSSRVKNPACPKPELMIVQAWGNPLPSPNELRLNYYLPIIHGATAIVVFVENQAWMKSLNGISEISTPLHWTAASRTNHEIETNKKVFLSKTAPDSEVYHIYFERQGSTCFAIKNRCEGCGDKRNCHEFDNNPTECQKHPGCGEDYGKCSGEYCGLICSNVTNQQNCTAGCNWVNQLCPNQSASPIHTILKDTGETGVRYLMAANIEYTAINGKFEFDKNPVKVTSVFDDNRTIAPNGNFFTDTFPALGINLYRIEFENNAIKQTKLAFKIKFQGINTQKSDKTVKITLTRGATIQSFDSTVTADNNGIYSGELANLTPDTYTIYLKGFAHLQKKVGENVAVLADKTTSKDWSSLELPAGDINNSNSITIQDFGLLSQNYRGAESVADLNLDGIVNIQDFGYLSQNYRLTGD